jgi:hypothetical protein
MPTVGETNDGNGHLPDDSVVVRGGMMHRKDLIASARRYADRFDGVWGLTFWSWPGLSAGEIALRIKEAHPEGLNPIGHGQMRESTAGKIRAAAEDGRAFQLEKTGGEGHYTLTFPSEPTDADWNRLDIMFGPPEPNPAAD